MAKRWVVLTVISVCCCIPVAFGSEEQHASSNSNSETVGINQSEVVSIIGGRPAATGAYPSYAIPDGKYSPCGSTLIHPDILLTGAHCGGYVNLLRNRGQEKVFIGGNFRSGSDAKETIALDLQCRHPKYRYNPLKNPIYDFMLVKLKRPSSAPLVQWNTDPKIPADNELLTILGYGQTVSGNRKSKPDVLLQSQVESVNITSVPQSIRNLNSARNS
jgi:V8-like Glu-specific endopeptidase